MSKQCMKLKPCPFCGSEDVRKTRYEWRDSNSQDVFCTNCCEGVSGEGGRDAFINWNSRPLEDKLQTQLRNLKMDVDMLIGIFWDYTNGHVEYEELLNHIKMLETHIGLGD